MSTALLQTTYFGPVQWYQKLHRYDCCYIEQHDSYQKQTYQKLRTCVSATITSGVAYIGMRCSRPIARVRSSTIMPMTSILSLRRNIRFCSISTRPSARRCVPSSIYTRMWFIVQRSWFRGLRRRTSVTSFTLNIRSMTTISRQSLIGRSFSTGMVFSRISLSWICCFVWDQTLFFIYNFFYLSNSSTI